MRTSTDTYQDKRLIRLVNKAKSLASMYSQASLIIPLALPQKSSSNVALDHSSPWHVGALFNSAMESASLYTRLKTTDRVNSTNLGNIADLLNVFGKQTIVNLQLSPMEPPKAITDGDGGSMQLPTGRGELYDRLNALDYDEQPESESEKEITKLGIDLSSFEEGITSSTGFRRGKKPHLFSQVCTARGKDALTGFNVEKPNEEYSRFERPKTYK